MGTLIPAHLLASAYQAENGELAWDKQRTLSVLRWAEHSRVCVIGVEVWLPTIPGPTIPAPFLYSFEPLQAQGESQAEYIARANREVVNYVTNFVWDNRDTAHSACRPYFNLTFDLGPGELGAPTPN